MAKIKVDLTKPFGLVYGHETGAKYEQDNKLFGANGELILDMAAPAKKAKEPAAPQEEAAPVESVQSEAAPVADDELTALKAEAKALGIKSPHLFSLENLKLKVDEAKMAALATGETGETA